MAILPFPDMQQGCSCRAAEWINLPVAPQATARRRFDGEAKRPQAVPLSGALTWIADLASRGETIAGFNIGGPGDPLAALPMTLEMLRALREKYPGMPLGITTLGLGLAGCIDELAENGVVQLTVLMDGVRPETIARLYTWIRPGTKNIPISEASVLLIEEQAKGLAATRSAGIEASVLTTVYPGVNEAEIEEISQKVSGLGVQSMILAPGKGRLPDGEVLDPLPLDAMDRLVMKAERHLRSVSLHRPKSGCDIIPLSGNRLMQPEPSAERPNVAVLSSNGMDIDLHLGQAVKALVYGPREDGLASMLEMRELPEPGGGDARWLKLAEVLSDCFALLATSAGQKPREILGRSGILVLLCEDNIEGAVESLFGGNTKGKHNTYYSGGNHGNT